PLVNDVGKLETDDTKMTVLLNEYFCSVSTIENQGILNPEDIIAAKRIEALTTVNYSPVEVIKYIYIYMYKLKVTESPGSDQIHPRIPLETRSEIANIFQTVAPNLSQMAPAPLNGERPMLPQFLKKRDDKGPGNFRPIRRTSVIGKLMDSLITDKITEFMESIK
ncbi:hypothetical protein EQH57_1144, partial [Dictyocoela roeselum]